MSLEIIETIRAMREVVRETRRRGRTVGFVPTMGALHRGHARLIEQCRTEADLVVVSIFVNPTQFGPREDLGKYPRTLDSDREVCALAGTDRIFLPSVETMYPIASETMAFVEVPGLTDILEGACRPGHFRGVATVVLKFFNIIEPDFAYFGAKDFQQQLVIKRMVADLDLAVEIRTVPTVRESDGLALSSRNRYLGAEERRAAAILSEALRRAKASVFGGERDANRVRQLLRETIGLEPLVILEYAEVADAHSLERLDGLTPGRTAVGLLAARVGSTRLIDNETLTE